MRLRHPPNSPSPFANSSGTLKDAADSGYSESSWQRRMLSAADFGDWRLVLSAAFRFGATRKM
jgi:hypothetical protein